LDASSSMITTKCMPLPIFICTSKKIKYQEII